MSLNAVTDATFRTLVEEADGMVLVDFAADWCAPCRIVHPILEQIAVEYADRITVLSLDADENPSTAARFGARSLPTVLFFRGGQVVDRVVGAVPRRTYLDRIEKSLARVAEPA
jgi:thioredoxin 1